MLIASEAEKQTPYFEKNVSEHIVKQISGDDDVVKLWRCGKPESSMYMFYICSAPNCFVIYGDMGECIWQRNYDMIPWVRGAIDSFDYFASKTPASVRDSITEIKWVEDGEEWTKEVAEKYMWQWRAVKWFIEKLDSGEVTK